MTETVSGNAGARFNVTKTDNAVDTGEVTILHSIETAVGGLTLTNSDKVVSYAGSVGKADMVFDLNALDNFTTGSGDTMKIQNATAPIALASLRCLWVHNKATDTANIINLDNASGASFFLGSEHIPVYSTSAGGWSISTAKTITAGTNNHFIIRGQADSIACEMYLIGT